MADQTPESQPQLQILHPQTPKSLPQQTLPSRRTLQLARILPYAAMMICQSTTNLSTTATLGADYAPLDTYCLDNPCQKKSSLRTWSHCPICFHRFMWATRLCPHSSKAFTLHQIGHKFAILNGFARSNRFRRSAIDDHNFQVMHVEDIWKAACVSPHEQDPPKNTVKETVATPFAHLQRKIATARWLGGGWSEGACTHNAEETECEIRCSEVRDTTLA